MARIGEWIAGPLGAFLSHSGIEAAVVGTDGAIRAVSTGFAERATGDPSATLAGQDFVAQLRSDDRERIYFAREGAAARRRCWSRWRWAIPTMPGPRARTRRLR